MNNYFSELKERIKKGARDKRDAAIMESVRRSVQVKEWHGRLYVSINGIPHLPLELLHSDNGTPDTAAICQAVDKIRSVVLCYEREKEITRQ